MPETNERVTVTLPPEVVRDIDQFEKPLQVRARGRPP